MNKGMFSAGGTVIVCCILFAGGEPARQLGGVHSVPGSQKPKCTCVFAVFKVGTFRDEIKVYLENDLL
jgi:hypothetical protein